ncbi:hypothetical protein ABZ770_02245 [Streptomyces sp. NPDC006654]|uniref:hypothetical protein n=1 Tax=Streptomyces sp. NPDC006654 TaxID=3156897 RepID=UPI0033F137AD
MVSEASNQVSSWERDVSELSGMEVGSREFEETYGSLFSRKWEIGRKPQSDADWITEYKLLKEGYTNAMRALLKEKENRTQLLNEEMGKKFQLGKRPETPEEIEAEAQLRDTERRWEVELEDRKHRATLESHDRSHKATLAANQANLVQRAESIRGWALVAVVVTIVISPWVAIFAGVRPEDFGLYMIPVTGIGGTIIGYWFGQGGRATAPSHPFPQSLETLPPAGDVGPLSSRTNNSHQSQ